MFTCPFCNSEMECDDELENQETKCPLCGEAIVPVRSNDIVYNEEKNKAIHNKMKLMSLVNEAVKSNSKIRQGNLIDSSYKKPLLALIFYYSGLFWLAASVLVLMVGIYLLAGNDRVRIEPLIAIVSMIGCAIIDFGIAEIINCVAKTAYNTGKIVDLLKKDRK